MDGVDCKMFKKIVTGAVVAMILTCYSTIAFAGTVITITRPEGDEVTYNPTYMICGNTDKQDVTVEVKVYDSNAGSYVPLYTTDGEYGWGIGSSGIFMKEVKLPYYDANKIQVVSYSKSEIEEKQFNNFTITLLRDNIKDKIVNGVIKIKDMLGRGIFD